MQGLSLVDKFPVVEDIYASNTNNYLRPITNLTRRGLWKNLPGVRSVPEISDTLFLAPRANADFLSTQKRTVFGCRAGTVMMAGIFPIP